MDYSSLLSDTSGTPLSTHVEQCPEGEFRAIIDDGDKAIQFFEIDTKNGKSHQARVSFKVLDENVKKTLGRDNVYVPMKIWLDMVGEKLDTSKGKNTGLGRLYDALGINDGSGSIGKLKGRGPVIIKVSHQSDAKDPTIKYAQVDRVAKLS